MAGLAAARVHDDTRQRIVSNAASVWSTGSHQRDLFVQIYAIGCPLILATLDVLQQQQTTLHMLVVSFEHRRHCRGWSKSGPG